MPTSLVTGIAGFIGSHVADTLLERGHTVLGLDDLSGGFRANVPAGARFVEGSITDPACIDALFAAHRIDYVYHLAAYAAEGLSPFIRRFNYANNLVGSVNLINAAVNAGTVRCFVFTSSMAVYGAGQVPMDEAMTPAPEDPYGVAKYAVEQDLRLAREQFGLDSVIFRPHNVYGARQNIADRYRNVIGIFMNQVLRGEPMTIYGDGMQTRAFSDVADVAPIIARSVERPAAYGEVINVGADRPYTVRAMAEEVARAMGVTPNIVHLEARHEVKHAYARHDKQDALFGDLKQGVTLPEGLARMAAWVKAHGPQEPTRFEGLEITRELYSFWQDDAQQEDAVGAALAAEMPSGDGHAAEPVRASVPVLSA